MSGLTRYVRVLRLYGERFGERTIAEMAAALGLPQSTTYRIVREMVTHGFLEVASDARYRLGPLFVEYDRLTRLTDPLYEVGGPMLLEIATQARLPCDAVLARIYNDTVMCVADAASPEGSVNTSYERGRPRPLAKGATSKVILAQLPTRRLSRLIAEDREGAAVDVLRNELAVIRKRGYCITRGEVDEGRVGIAAPITAPARGLIGSLSLVLSKEVLDPAAERRLALLVVSTASLLTEALTTAEPRLKLVCSY